MGRKNLQRKNYNFIRRPTARACSGSSAASGIPLKLQPDRAEGVNVITAFEPGIVRVNAQALHRSVIVPWQGDTLDWDCSDFSQLTSEHFERVLALSPELVIFGSGARLRFAAPALLRSLIVRGIGVESMDTAAACRTYNVLAAEGRTVVAALLIEAPAVA